MIFRQAKPSSARPQKNQKNHSALKLTVNQSQEPSEHTEDQAPTKSLNTITTRRILKFMRPPRQRRRGLMFPGHSANINIMNTPLLPEKNLSQDYIPIAGQKGMERRMIDCKPISVDSHMTEDRNCKKRVLTAVYGRPPRVARDPEETGQG